MIIKRKCVVKVLNENQFYHVPKKERSIGSHSKYRRINSDGTTTTYSLHFRETLEKQIIQDISKVTGIPVEHFYRSRGSKKHQNGFGTFGLFRGSFN